MRCIVVEKLCWILANKFVQQNQKYITYLCEKRTAHHLDDCIASSRKSHICSLFLTSRDTWDMSHFEALSLVPGFVDHQLTEPPSEGDTLVHQSLKTPGFSRWRTSAYSQCHLCHLVGSTHINWWLTWPHCEDRFGGLVVAKKVERWVGLGR